VKLARARRRGRGFERLHAHEPRTTGPGKPCVTTAHASFAATVCEMNGDHRPGGNPENG
jgi:hypothetical protein